MKLIQCLNSNLDHCTKLIIPVKKWKMSKIDRLELTTNLENQLMTSFSSMMQQEKAPNKS